MPPDLRKELKNDSFYEQSALSWEAPVQWHHVFMFAGKSIQEKWNIVPLTKSEHDMVTPHNPIYVKQLDEMVQQIALNRATVKELKKYSKVDNLVEKKDRLNKKYDKTNTQR